MKSLKAQLMAAIAMTLVAALTIGSSTYAWFTMNGSVSATDMTVNAQTSSMFLVIGTTNDKTKLQEDNLSQAKAVTKTADLKPAEHSLDPIGPGVPEDEEVTWHYFVAERPDKSDATGSQIECTPSELGSYRLENTFYITTAAGSDAVKNLRATKCTISDPGEKSNQAIRVLVYTAEGSTEFTPASKTSTKVLAADVNKDTVIPVHVCIYYDGDDGSVFTNNAMNLAEASVSISFAVDENKK